MTKTKTSSYLKNVNFQDLIVIYTKQAKVCYQKKQLSVIESSVLNRFCNYRQHLIIRSQFVRFIKRVPSSIEPTRIKNTQTQKN